MGADVQWSHHVGPAACHFVNYDGKCCLLQTQQELCQPTCCIFSTGYPLVVTLRMMLSGRPLVSDRVSFELSQEAVEALRAKLVSTPGFGAFGQQQQQSQPQQPLHQPSLHGRPPPSPSLQEPADPEFLRWKVQL
jgi:hypothetical protein